jgi:hypothetical protein
MSLIQEALRRQQAEQQTGNAGAKSAPAIPPPSNPPEPAGSASEAKPPLRKLSMASRNAAVKPATSEETPPAEKPREEPAEPEFVDTPPADAPEPSTDETSESESTPEDEIEPTVVRTSTERKHHVLLPLIGALLVLTLLIGLVAWAIQFGMHLLSERAADTSGTGMHDSVKESGTIDPTADPASIPETLTTTDPSTAYPLSPAGVEPVTNAKITTPEIRETMQPVHAPNPVVIAVTEPAAPPPVTPPPPPRPRVIWPDLHVSGFVGDGRSGSAIINGKVIGLNEAVEGATVREFGRGYVTLEYQGETRQFSVGRPLRQ